MLKKINLKMKRLTPMTYHYKSIIKVTSIYIGNIYSNFIVPSKGFYISKVPI